MSKKTARKAKRSKTRNARTVECRLGKVDFTANTLLGSASERPRKITD